MNRLECCFIIILTGLATYGHAQNDPEVIPKDTTVCEGAQVLYNLVSAPPNVSSYQWQEKELTGSNWEDISGATQPKYLATGTTPGKEYRVKMVLINSNEVNSEPATMLVLLAPPPVTLNNNSPGVCPGGDVEIQITSAIPPGISISWTGPNQFSNTLKNIVVSDPGQYTVTLSGPAGCGTTSATATVTQFTSPAPQISASANLLCANQSLTLTVENVLNISSLKWEYPNQDITYAPSPWVVPNLQGGTYSVTATDQNGCTGEDNILITVNDLPDINITPQDTTVCAGQPITFKATGNNLIAWQWVTPSGATFNGSTFYIANPATGTYLLTVTDNNNCTNSATSKVSYPTDLNNVSIIASRPKICEGQKVILSVSGINGNGYDYQWNGPGITGTDDQLQISLPGTYWLTVTNPLGCNGQYSITIEEEKVNFQISAPDNVCQGLPFQLTTSPPDAASSPWQWLWNGTALNAPVNVQTVNVTTPLNPNNYTYTVTVTNANGCTGTQSKVIQVVIPPAPVIQGSVAVCGGAVGQLFVTMLPYDSFEWKITGNCSLKSESSRSFALTNWEKSGNGIVSVEVWNGGCKGTDNASITIQQDQAPPPGYIFLKPSGDILIFDNDTVDISGYTYQWGAVREQDVNTYEYDQAPLPANINSVPVNYDRQYLYIGTVNTDLYYYVDIQEQNSDCKTRCWYPSNPYERSDADGQGVEVSRPIIQPLLLYPNPTPDGLFTAKIQSAFSDMIHFRLMSTSGVLIEQGRLPVSKNEVVFDFRSKQIPAGMYWLEIFNPSFGLFSASKLIIHP